MPQTEVSFATDQVYSGHKLPDSVTVDLPFDLIQSVISNRPLKRRTIQVSQPFTPDELKRLRDQAGRNPPPDSWFNEDFTDVR